MQYLVNIGIEIHCELNTKTKLFSASENAIDKVANTLVNEIDFGYPGTLPQINKQAVEKAILLANLLNCEIANKLLFDRKHYFYFDLPKGFQITQYFKPIGKNGYLEIWDKEMKSFKKIKIMQIQIEEDTAKQFKEKDAIKLDFNRAGCALLEIVSDADSITSAQDAVWYIFTLRETLKYYAISEAKMELGQFRCDVNISLRKNASDSLGTKVEVKNLNSLNAVKKAIEYEIQRQTKILENNQKVLQETRRYVEKDKTTESMRSKSNLVDYRYFRDPNQLEYDLSCFANYSAQQENNRLISFLKKIFGINENIDAQNVYFILENHEVVNYFAEINETFYEIFYNLLNTVIFPFLKDKNLSFDSFKIKISELEKLFACFKNKKITFSELKEILLTNFTNEKYEFKDILISENKEINYMEFLKKFEKDIYASKNNIEKLSKYLLGQLMKQEKGKGNVQEINNNLLTHLHKWIENIK